MAEILASLIGKEWSLSFTSANIMAGFRKSGAYPLNLGVIKDKLHLPLQGILLAAENLLQM